jgi:predicted acyl esterase
VPRLTDIFPDGRSYTMADGIVRARDYETAQESPPTPIELDRLYEYIIGQGPCVSRP